MYSIDSDFNPLKKEQIMEEFRQEFGNVFNCATFGTCSSKSAIQNAGRGLGIDNDITMYISSMIPMERGALWTLDECFNGNEEKDRKPLTEFINEVAKYENLKETALMFEGVIDKRSSHASAVYIFNDGIASCNSMMRTPSGTSITQYSMTDSDYQSALKMDILWTEAQAKMQTCLELLIEKGVIEDKGSLKANYDEYLHPDKIEYLDKQMWEKAYSGEIIDLFQFSTAIGLASIKQTKPINLYEATATNCLMRLMGQEGQLSPLDKFTLYKSDISKWYEEMNGYGLNEQEVKLLEEYLLTDYGVANTQETMMKTLMAIGLTLTNANYARKVVAKKKFRDIDKLKKLIYEIATEKGFRVNLIDYVWDMVVMPQAGYGFSILHSLSYTIVAIQTMNLYVDYPTMYWNTACLIVNAGSEDGNTDYGKIAVAIGDMKKNNVNVALPHINLSELLFNPDNDRILFGFKGISKINHEDANIIIANRPYSSLKDFYDKNSEHIQKGKIVNLIKSGAFDELEGKSRVEIMKDFITMSSDSLKSKLTTANLPQLMRYSSVPDEFEYEVYLYNLRKYLTDKSFLKNTVGSKKWYRVCPVNSLPYFEKHYLGDLEEDKDYKFNSKGEILVCDKSLEKHFKSKAKKLLTWLSSDEALDIANRLVLREDWMKYVKSSSIPRWEMETVTYYNSEHELEHVDEQSYATVNYFDMPEIPIVSEEGVSKKGKPYKRFEINSIMGTVVNKDAGKHFVSLLTRHGVVNIKFSKGAFNFYNKQLSEVDPSTEKKTVIEKSWFSRGTMLLIRGFRDGDIFRARAYGDLHSISRIEGIQENGLLYLTMERAQAN